MYIHVVGESATGASVQYFTDFVDCIVILGGQDIQLRNLTSGSDRSYASGIYTSQISDTPKKYSWVAVYATEYCEKLIAKQGHFLGFGRLLLGLPLE